MAEHILLVDDQPLNLKLARIILEAEGFTVHTALDGVAMWRLLEAGLAPDLVFMDLQLPVTDGLSLTRALRADPRFAHVPIVALTAYAMTGDAERALEAGCDDYLTKPIDTRRFGPQVRRWLGTRHE